MVRRRGVWFVCLTFVVALGLARGAPAAGSAVEELTKMLPDDVVYFVATSGGAALEEDFRQSALGQLWYDPGLQTFVTSIKTELLKALEEKAQEEDVAERIAAGLDCAQLVLDRPIVVGIAEVDVKVGPPLCVFTILDAGERKSELAGLLTQIETSLGEEMIGEIEVGSLKMHTLKKGVDVPPYWGWVDRHLVVAFNDRSGTTMGHVVTPRAAATGHLAKVPGHGDLLAMYCDVGKVLEVPEALVEAEGDREDLTRVRAVIETLGISRLGTVVGRVGFSGANLVTGSFVGAPAPRTGLPAAFRPIDVSVFSKVDGRAVRATALNIDLAGIYDTVMKVMQIASPDRAYRDIQKQLSDFESGVGFRVREGLLASLGGPVVVYQLPAGKMVEAPMGGIVAVAKLADAAVFEKTLVQIGGFVAGVSDGAFQVSSQTGDDGRTMHVWANPALSLAQMMPSWSVAKDHVVIGSNMALCKMGIERIIANGVGAGSLLDTDGFKKVMADLPAGLVSATYADSGAVLTQGLMQLQQLWPMVMMISAQAGIKLPVMVPSLGHITGHIEPSCEYSYVRAEGVYSHYRGAGIEMSLRSVAGTAFGMGVLMPALARVRELAFRMTSGTNLSAIGKACRVYADDHEDKLPPDLETLVKEVDLPAKCLESKRRPAGFDEPSYVYVTGQTLDMYPGNIVAYEDPRYCLDGVNVLFLDSHVEFMKPASFRRELKATYERLGRDVPAIRFREEIEADEDSAGPGPV